jgi:peroxiredoxin
MVVESPLLPRILTIAAIVTLGLVACGSSPSAGLRKAALKSAKDRKPAPQFTLKDVDGKDVQLSAFKGQVVLVNFWATWCGPCKIEIPWFIEFEQKYKDRGFAVLGVSLDEDGWEAVKPYIARHKINYRIMVDTTETVSKLYGPFTGPPSPEEPEQVIASLPTTFLIDRAGRVASVHIGLVSKSNYVNDITALLEDSAPGGSRAAVPGVAGAD